MSTPLDFPCAHCGAEPGDRCKTATGRETDMHVDRLEADYDAWAYARALRWSHLNGPKPVDGAS